MRKRRRLVNKLTIMVCAVLVAVSAFFYAPMEVSAQSVTQTNSGFRDLKEQHLKYTNTFNDTFSAVTLFNGNDDTLYEVDLSFVYNLQFSGAVYLRNCVFSYGDSILYSSLEASNSGLVNSHTFDFDVVFYAKGSQLKNNSFIFDGRLLSNVVLDSVTYNSTLTYSINSVTALSAQDSSDYENGYNAGYAEGETAGYGNGYSQGFADGEASVDTDKIYDEAFQAGKDSVDTQSYYDAGYQAGYDAAYSAGYESGYDVGYQSAMDRIDSWGADTKEYPILLSSVVDKSSSLIGSIKTSYPLQYEFSADWKSTIDYNPFHTYKFVLNFVYDFDSELSSDVYALEDDLWTFDIGSLSYNINPGSDVTNVFFIPGDRISSSYSFTWHPILAIYGNVMTSDTVYCGYTVSFDIYDMGPSGDTQNHIANQTDQLTNGFDESQGNSVNSDLSTGLNEYQTAEDSLWATATTGLKDFTFFDFESVPAMITGMSFITSIMGSWFSHAGGASGVGIVLSILFSVMLVAMVLGLYRLYQSKGGKK